MEKFTILQSLRPDGVNLGQLQKEIYVTGLGGGQISEIMYNLARDFTEEHFRAYKYPFVTGGYGL